MNRIAGSLLILLLLLGATAASAQNDPANPGDQPDPPGTVLPPEQWDDTEPSTIKWDEASRSALDDTFFVKKNALRTSVKIVGINTLIWFYDRYIREGGTNPGFRIGFNSWQENLTNGFEWDDNNFTTNQFAHPYHGSLYFNAARSNGYDFWESIPWTFGGSFLWEYFFEVHHPSMNDWISTSVGGITLGEILHRLSMSVRDNTATGSKRNWREVGGLLINPMAGVTRLIDGDWGRVHANPEDRFPRNFRSQMDLGFRKVAEENLFSRADTTKFYIRFDFEYGDVFDEELDDPFDYFDFDLQLNFNDVTTLGRVDVNGSLGGHFLKETDPASHLLGSFLRFDYINNSKMEFGAQSLGAGFMSRFESGPELEMRTEVHTNVILLGANKSDYRSSSGRSYDYGPGFSVDFAVKVAKNDWNYLSAGYVTHWIYTVNGNDAHHTLAESYLRLDMPIRFNLGLGLEYRLMNSERKYADYPDVSERLPELRLISTWLLH